MEWACSSCVIGGRVIFFANAIWDTGRRRNMGESSLTSSPSILSLPCAEFSIARQSFIKLTASPHNRCTSTNTPPSPPEEYSRIVNLQKSVLRHLAVLSSLFEYFVLILRDCNVSEIRLEITCAGVPYTTREVRNGGKSSDRRGNVVCSTCHLRTRLDSLLDRRCGNLMGDTLERVSSGVDTPCRCTSPPPPPGSTRFNGGSKCSVR